MRFEEVDSRQLTVDSKSLRFFLCHCPLATVNWPPPMPYFLALTVLFIGLKLAGITAWAWLWVLSPIWCFAIIALFATAFLIWSDDLPS